MDEDKWKEPSWDVLRGFFFFFFLITDKSNEHIWLFTKDYKILLIMIFFASFLLPGTTPTFPSFPLHIFIILPTRFMNSVFFASVFGQCRMPALSFVPR